MKKQIFFFLAILIFASCEDIIEVDVTDGESQLVVDAWINDLPETQTIRLTRTESYFENTFADGVTGANVYIGEGSISQTDTIIDMLYEFKDEDNDGTYTWTPGPGDQLIKTGKDYGLFVQLEDDLYVSVSRGNRSMPIDSIGYEFMEEMVGQPEGIYAQVYARDSISPDPQVPDVYWIKAFKNGEFLNKPSEMNLAWNNVFGPGDMDTTLSLLIPPLRLGINRVPDFEDDAVDDPDVPPYQIGDNIRVEIHSLTPEAFFFLSQAREQMTNGDNGIFALPVTNVPTNIFPAEEGAKENPIGFFCVSRVEVAEVDVE